MLCAGANKNSIAKKFQLCRKLIPGSATLRIQQGKRAQRTPLGDLKELLGMNVLHPAGCGRVS